MDILVLLSAFLPGSPGRQGKTLKAGKFGGSLFMELGMGLWHVCVCGRKNIGGLETDEAD